ncbi:MAG: PadR family transcriptional regulator [Pseudonocardia sp.]
MSATRLLVLGIVRGYGRAHGYRVGHDLLSWGADEWANVKWGSIYHALRALTQSGFLLDHNDILGRTDYELTERGEAEFIRLLSDALRRPEPRPDLARCRPRDAAGAPPCRCGPAPARTVDRARDRPGQGSGAGRQLGRAGTRSGTVRALGTHRGRRRGMDLRCCPSVTTAT